MVDATYGFVAGDTASKIRVTCKNKGTGLAIDLTDSAIELLWKTRKGVLVTKTMVPEDAENGIAYYVFVADELEGPNMKFEVKITDVGGNVLRSLDTLYELVREGLS